MFLETLTERFTSIAASAGVLPYGIIFAVIFIESIILIGFFMPAETLLVLIGFLISEGVIRFPFLDMVLLAAVAAISGNIGSFLLGRFWYEPIAAGRLGRRWPALLLKGELFFECHGGKSVFFGRFFNLFRSLIPFVAGCVRMKWAPFLFWTIAGSFTWSAAFLLLGFYAGQAWHRIFALSSHVTVTVGIVVAVAAVVFFAIRLRQQEKKGERQLEISETNTEQKL